MSTRKTPNVVGTRYCVGVNTKYSVDQPKIKSIAVKMDFK